MKNDVLSYFQKQAETGDWDNLYNPANPMSHPFIIRLQKTLDFIDDINGKKVCDLGCGTGELIPFILEKNGIYTGIDFSEKMINSIKLKYLKKVEEKKVKLIAMDYKNINKEEKFDVLIGLGFIEYFENPEEIIKKLYDAIPNGGTLILSFPNSICLENIIIKFTTYLRLSIKKIFKIGKPHPPRKLWSKGDAMKMLKKNGFQNLKSQNYFINLLVYPIKVIFPKLSYSVSKKLEYTWLSKFTFFANGFILLAKK